MNQKFPVQVPNLGVPDWYTNDLLHSFLGKFESKPIAQAIYRHQQSVKLNALVENNDKSVF